MNDEIRFTVYGEPFGKERPKFTVVENKKSDLSFLLGEDDKRKSYVKAYTPRKTRWYEEKIKIDFYEQVLSKRNSSHYFEKGDMIKMEIIAYFGIPKSTTKKKISLMLEKILRPIKKPDIDNIFKVIADGLNGLAYKDDAQIVEGVVKKYYSDNPRVEVIISKVEAARIAA